MKRTLDWQIATLKAVRQETAHVKSFSFRSPTGRRTAPGSTTIFG